MYHDRFEHGAHMTLFDRQTEVSFYYCEGEAYVNVSVGGYGEPPVVRLPVPAIWADSEGPTLPEFTKFCVRHIMPDKPSENESRLKPIDHYKNNEEGY